MWKHSKALYSIAFGKFCDTFSFFGTQTILIFYLMGVFHFSKTNSFIVFGIYSALLYISPLICGYIADNYLGTKHMLMLGVVLNALGNFLIFLSPSQFWIGLVIVLLGSGAYRTTSAKLIGNDADVNPNSNKEPGYTFYYFISNLGGFLSPIIFGLIFYTKHWNYCYLLSSTLFIMAFIGLIPALGVRRFWLEAQSYKAILIGYLSIFAAGLIMLSIFELKQINNSLIFSIGFFSAAIVLAALSLRHAVTNQKIKLLLLFNLYGLIYFTAGFQIPSTLLVFIQSKINLGEMTSAIPPSAYAAFYPLAVIAIVPIISSMKKFKALPSTKLWLSLIITMVSLCCFILATLNYYIVVFILLGIFIMGLAESILVPVGYSLIADNTPQKFLNIMMGIRVLFIGIGGYLSGFTASIASQAHRAYPLFSQPYLDEFLYITATLGAIGLIFFVIDKHFALLKQLTIKTN